MLPVNMTVKIQMSLQLVYIKICGKTFPANHNSGQRSSGQPLPLSLTCSSNQLI